VSEVSNSSKNPDGSKTCRDCGETKARSDFPRNAGLPDGYGIYCKSCFAIRYRTYREKKAVAEGRQIQERRVVPPGEKYCPRCEQVLPLDSFGRNRSARDGHTSYCKPCHNAVGRETKQRLYGGNREYHLRQRYGLTSADVEAMIQTQGGTCAVCPGKPEHVDHDHESGKVRGILCFNCNQALGNVRDSSQVLRGLARYLDAHDPSLRLVIDENRWVGKSPVEVRLRHHLAS
jgi:hypothetical protein